MPANFRIPALVLSSLLAACGGLATPGDGFAEDGDQPVMTWTEFRAQVFRERSTGYYVFDGDTLVRDEKELRALWQREFAGPRGGLIVNTVGGADDKWTEAQKKQLTWCVNPAFGANRQAVVDAMDAATHAWEAVADVKFVHLAAEDDACTVNNANVLFDVSPSDAYVSYLARAFFPSSSRSEREVLIAPGAFTSAKTTLTGILRHELGHTLGFRHEHTRPESGTCFENSNWRPLTPYDRASVMHYPQCNGTDSWALEITEDDAAGAANLYGAPGGSPTPSPAPSPSEPSQPSDAPTFTGHLDAKKRATHGPLAVVGGRTLTVRIDASQGTTTYVRFGAKPTTGKFDAQLVAGETRTLTVPQNRRVAYFLVVAGTSATEYDLFAAMSPPAQPSQPTPPAGPRTWTFSGTVETYRTQVKGPLGVTAGRTLTVTLDGSGDPDLRVSFGDTAGAVAGCSSNRSDLDICSVTVPEGATQAWIEVYGYSASAWTATATLR